MDCKWKCQTRDMLGGEERRMKGEQADVKQCRCRGGESDRGLMTDWDKEIDEVTDRCDLLLVQLLPEPEAAPLVTSQQGGGGR